MKKLLGTLLYGMGSTMVNFSGKLDSEVSDYLSFDAAYRDMVNVSQKPGCEEETVDLMASLFMKQKAAPIRRNVRSMAKIMAGCVDSLYENNRDGYNENKMSILVGFFNHHKVSLPARTGALMDYMGHKKAFYDKYKIPYAFSALQSKEHLTTGEVGELNEFIDGRIQKAEKDIETPQSFHPVNISNAILDSCAPMSVKAHAAAIKARAGVLRECPEYVDEAKLYLEYMDAQDRESVECLSGVDISV